MDYSSALEEIIKEILSLQGFVHGCIFVFNSEKLVFPLLSSILERVGPGLVGFINLQEIVQETFHGEESRSLVSICEEVLTESYDLSDAQETSRVFFLLVRAVFMKLDFDNFVAPYCQYRSVSALRMDGYGTAEDSNQKTSIISGIELPSKDATL